MMVYIQDLKRGDKVTYNNQKGTVQKGIVKTILDHRVFVVYGLTDPEDWKRYYEFTGSLTPVEFLTKGW